MTSQNLSFEGQKVLITGGLGFIGSTLAIKLLETGAKVTLVDSLEPQYGGHPKNIAGYEEQLDILQEDVRNTQAIRKLIQEQNYLFNLAGQTSHLDSMQDPETDLAINCTAQLSILETCRHHNPSIRIVFASTRQIYGTPQYLPVDEKHPLRPVDVNGINKLAGEQYHLLYNNIHGLRSSVLRLTNTIGPRMRIRDARQTFLGIWIRRLLEGDPFEVWGGQQLRDLTDVEDCVEALMLSALSDKTSGQAFNLGGHSTLSLRELAELLIEIHGDGVFQICEFPKDRAAIDIGDYYASDKLFRETTGWAPKIDLKDTLSRTLDYYAKHLQDYTASEYVS
ncbi:MAG: NAD-dependent epimerase/dehydratase family protein [Deltaproteobacteria bacterium]|jgi:UDP-glucose 4-epimerase|nr:NAD-dependent epimerase/dehydratase family protein [Deltaproteobacteria bacterium]MBT6488285.1 NAD-dependent epimerase/dehydratase family protein [Deltaproteobacteria bacterium]